MSTNLGNVSKNRESKYTRMKLFLLLVFLCCSAPSVFSQKEESYYCTDWDYKLIPYRKGNCWGYADPQGKIVVEPQFEAACLLRLGRARVCLNGKYGYVNRFGNIAIEPQFESATEFGEHSAKVSRDSKTFLIDRAGKILEPSPGTGMRCGGVITTIRYFERYACDGKIMLLTNKCCVFDSIQNKRVVRCDTIPGKFDAVRENGKGLAAVSVGGKWGMLDRMGQMVLPFEFDEIVFNSYPRGPDTQYFGKVRQGNCWGMVDHKGKLIIPPQYETIGWFDQGVVFVNCFDKTGGYADRNGKVFFED